MPVDSPACCLELYDRSGWTTVHARHCIARTLITLIRYIPAIDVGVLDPLRIDGAKSLQEMFAAASMPCGFSVKCTTTDWKVSIMKFHFTVCDSAIGCRYEVVRFDDVGVKLGDELTCPDEISITDAVGRLHRESLASVVLHHGQTCLHGHYTVVIKSGGGLVNCNDASVYIRLHVHSRPTPLTTATRTPMTSCMSASSTLIPVPVEHPEMCLGRQCI